MKKILILCFTLIICLGLVGCDSSDYKKAMELFNSGEYAEAQTIFEVLGDYEDSASMVLQCDYYLELSRLYEDLNANWEQENWLTALKYAEELIQTYPDSDEAKKVQETIAAEHYQLALAAYDYLRNEKFADAKLMASFLRDDSEEARLINEMCELNSLVSTTYVADDFFISVNGELSPRSANRSYTLRTKLRLGENFEPSIDYFIELPGYFYSAMPSDGCFNYNCGSTGEDFDAIINNPNIDTYNLGITKYDSLNIDYGADVCTVRHYISTTKGWDWDCVMYFLKEEK